MADLNEAAVVAGRLSISDQQRTVFSNQLPSNAIQSLEVIDGAPQGAFTAICRMFAARILAEGSKRRLRAIRG